MSIWRGVGRALRGLWGGRVKVREGEGEGGRRRGGEVYCIVSEDGGIFHTDS